MKRQTVTLCIIARDEEATIGTTIKSVLALVDEVIVADTGSRDSTAIIAEGYGARVVEAPWEDDFAAARNRTLEMASGDWILVLDADEFMQSIRPVDFQRLLHDPAVAAYRVDVTDGAGAPYQDPGNRLRLFRNHPLLRFNYPVQDTLEAGVRAYCRATGSLVEESPLVVVNEGQTPARLLACRERDQRILRLIREADPQEPYFAYLAGCRNLCLLDDDVLPTGGMATSLESLAQGWRLMDPGPDRTEDPPTWFPDLGCKLISGNLALGRTDIAREISADVLGLYPHDPHVILQAVAADLERLKRIPSAAGSMEFQQTDARIRSRLDMITSLDEQQSAAGVDSRRLSLYPLRYRGELALLEGRVSEAVEMFEGALDLDPEYSFAWLGMAECCLFAGDRKRALKHFLRTVAACPANYRAWLGGCRLMGEMDCPGNAKTWWNRFCLQFPEHPAAGGRIPMDDLRCTSC